MRLLWCSVFCLIAMRLVGLAARHVRDAQLKGMIDGTVSCLENAKMPVFLDWSTLLGIWRDGGILTDEEDADLGVAVPHDELGAPISAGTSPEEAVAALIRGCFSGQPYTVVVDPGVVYLVPRRSRLHLDLYLVRHDEAAGVVRPLWPKPDHNTSHAASVHPRPFAGVARLHGLPVPSDPEAYLHSIFGYLGSPAAYDSETMLYVPAEPKPWHSSLLSDAAYLLLRDIYFVALIAPVSEDLRKAVERGYEWPVRLLEKHLCQGAALRDCSFHLGAGTTTSEL